MKDSFVLYASQHEAIKELSLTQKGLLLDVLFLYATQDIIPDVEDKEVRIAFNFIRQQIDKDSKKYSEKCEKNKKIALEREERRRKAREEYKRTRTYTNVTYNDNDNDNDNEPTNVGDNKEKTTNVVKKKGTSSRFVAPTVDEVRVYCKERGNYVSPGAFIDFYESKGWKVGSSPMKDWKAAVRTWERKDGRSPKKDTPSGTILGVGEWIDEQGDRRYGSGKYTVPMTAPPRPAGDCYWDAGTLNWVSGV